MAASNYTNAPLFFLGHIASPIPLRLITESIRVQTTSAYFFFGHQSCTCKLDLLRVYSDDIVIIAWPPSTITADPPWLRNDIRNKTTAEEWIAVCDAAELSGYRPEHIRR